MYVIWNLSQKAWVALPGQKRSYTSRVELARRFRTRSAAKADCCGDEQVVPMSDVVHNF